MCVTGRKNHSEVIKKLNGLFVSFTLEACMRAGTADNEKAEVSTLAEFISAKCTDADCSSAFVSGGQLIIGSNVDNDKVLVPVFSLNCAS